MPAGDYVRTTWTGMPLVKTMKKKVAKPRAIKKPAAKPPAMKAMKAMKVKK